MKKVLGIISANYNSDGFGELTKKRPVALLPFGGRYRLLDFPLTNMSKAGITTVGLITPFYYRSVMDHVGAGEPWGLARKHGGLFIMPGSVEGSRESSRRFVLRDLIRNRRICDRSTANYVLLSDASKAMTIDYDEMYQKHVEEGNKATLLYAKDGRFLDCILINKDFLLELMEDYKNSDNLDLSTVLDIEKDNEQIGRFVFDGYVCSIESIDDYIRANRDVLRPEIQEALGRTIITKESDAPPTLYKEGSSVKNCVVASGCIIKGSMENSILSRSVFVDENSVVKNSILMQRCIIGKNVVLENVVLDKYVEISDGVVLRGTESSPVVLGKGVKI